MPRFRPRFSLLTALLLMTIAGMAIVLVQLWVEVGPLRSEVRRLRDEVGALSIEDESKIHAIHVHSDDEDLTWKRRVWIPEGTYVKVSYQWGNAPKAGVPSGGSSTSFGSGEHLVTLRARPDPTDNHRMGYLAGSCATVGSSIEKDQLWFGWPQRASFDAGVGPSTVAFDDDKKVIILARRRVGPFTNSREVDMAEGPTAGFSIWLERQ